MNDNDEKAKVPAPNDKWMEAAERAKKRREKFDALKRLDEETLLAPLKDVALAPKPDILEDARPAASPRPTTGEHLRILQKTVNGDAKNEQGIPEAGIVSDEKNKNTCPVCNGKGRLQHYDDLGRCWKCDGTGRIPTSAPKLEGVQTCRYWKKLEINDEVPRNVLLHAFNEVIDEITRLTVRAEKVDADWHAELAGMRNLISAREAEIARLTNVVKLQQSALESDNELFIKRDAEIARLTDDFNQMTDLATKTNTELQEAKDEIARLREKLVDGHETGKDTMG